MSTSGSGTNYSKWRRDLFFYGLVLVCITLPFTKHINSLTIGAMAVCWLFSNSWKEKWSALRNNRWILLFIGYYLLHLLAMLYTENTKVGGFILEKKSGMWVLPVLLASGTALNRLQLGKLLLWFILSCTVGITICLSNGLYWLWFEGSNEFLSHHGLTSIIGTHAVYYSAFLLFSVFVLIWFMREPERLPHKIPRWAVLTWIAYLVIGIFMLASKTIIMTLILLGSAVFIIQIIRDKKYKRFLTFLLLLLVSLTLLSRIPQTEARFRHLFNTEFDVLKLEKYHYDTPFNGLSLRMVIWKYTLRSLGEDAQWLAGVGPGDSQDLLDSTYKEIGIYTGNPNLGDHGYLGYNTHNQYLQSLLDLGVGGLLWLLFMFIYLIRRSLKDRIGILTMFILLFTAFCLTESAFEAHHGSVFFTLFTALLLSNRRVSAGSGQA